MTALVTGGTRRLGEAIAATLRVRGWSVIVSSHRRESGADIVADLSAPEGADRLFDAACSLNGGVAPDALVNNAAIFVGDGMAVRTIGFDSPKRLTDRMAERRDGSGAVVNILDAQCLVAPNGAPISAYAETKLRLLAYTRQSAMLYRGRLRVNAVAPGPVLPPDGFHLKMPPVPFGKPDSASVADAVAWLLAARFTSGCVIPVDGGVAIGQT